MAPKVGLKWGWFLFAIKIIFCIFFSNIEIFAFLISIQLSLNMYILVWLWCLDVYFHFCQSKMRIHQLILNERIWLKIDTNVNNSIKLDIFIIFFSLVWLEKWSKHETNGAQHGSHICILSILI